MLYRGEVLHFDTINKVAEFIASGSTDREICEVVSAILSAIAVKVRDEDCVRCGPSPFDAADARLIDRLADDIDRVALIAGGMADRLKWRTND